MTPGPAVVDRPADRGSPTRPIIPEMSLLFRGNAHAVYLRVFVECIALQPSPSG
jgi:hypothetical protein